jgi:hypothetical protein
LPRYKNHTSDPALSVAVVLLQHARALEAFARLMPQAPEQLVPLIKTSFECMATIQLEQNGQLPPPAKVTWRWKEEAMARISMAKVCGGLSQHPLARVG